MYKGQEYQVGATITEGDCEECMCYETLEGEMQMNCYPSCNISPSVCKAVSWLLVLNLQESRLLEKSSSISMRFSASY